MDGGETLLPSTPETDERVGPVVMRIGELSMTPTSYITLGRAGTALSLGNTIEPTLLAEVWVSQPHPLSVIWQQGLERDVLPPTPINA